MDNNNSVINWEDYNRILQGYRAWRDINEAVKKDIFDLMQKNGLTRSEVSRIFLGAKRLAIANQKDPQFVGFAAVSDLIKAISKTADLRVLDHFNKIYEKLNEYYEIVGEDFRNTDAEPIFKDCLRKAKELAGKSSRICDLVEKETIEYFWMLACIYEVLSENLSFKGIRIREKDFARIADGVMLTQINNLSYETFEVLKNSAQNKYGVDFKFGSKIISKEIEDLISALRDTTPLGKRGFKNGENLSIEEIDRLILKSSSVIFRSTQDKVYGAIDVLRAYINNANKKFEDKFSHIKIKDVFLGAGSILCIPTRTLADSASLLQGVSVKDLPQTKTKKGRKTALQMMFPDMSIDGIDSEDKQHIVLESKRTTFISLNINSLYRATDSMINCLYDALCEKNYRETIVDKVVALEALGVNFSKIFTGDNVFDIFPSNFIGGKKVDGVSEQDKFIANSKLLSKLISVDDLQKVIHHNFTFLTQDPQILKEQVYEIYKQYAETKDYEAYVKNVEELVNIATKAKPRAKSQNPSGIKYGPRKKVKNEKDEVSIDNAFIDEDLLKEFNLEGVEVPKPDKQKTVVVDENRQNVLKNVLPIIEEINNNPNEDDDEEEVEETADLSYQDELFNLSEEEIKILRYLDALKARKGTIVDLNKQLAKQNDGELSEVVKAITSLGTAGNALILNEKRVKNQVQNAHVFGDVKYNDDEEIQQIQVVLEILERYISTVQGIIDIYATEKTEVAKRLVSNKELRASEKYIPAGNGIKKIIDVVEEEGKKSKGLINKNVEKLVSELKQQLKSETESSDLVKTTKADDEQALKTSSVLSAQIFEFETLKTILVKKREQLKALKEQNKQEKLNQIHEQSTSLIYRIIEIKKEIGLIEKDVESDSKSKTKKQNFQKLKYKNGERSTSFSARNLDRIGRLEENISKNTEEIASKQTEISQLEEDLLELERQRKEIESL